MVYFGFVFFLYKLVSEEISVAAIQIGSWTIFQGTRYSNDLILQQIEQVVVFYFIL